MTIDAATTVVPRLYIRNRYDSCMFCGHAGYVHADHVRPRRAGGKSIPANLAPLCPMCNMIKSDFWSYPDFPSSVSYHPYRGLSDIRLAWQILHTEIDWLTGQFGTEVIDNCIWAAYGFPSGLGGWNHG